MEGERWRVEDGVRNMEDGRWRVEDGWWKMLGGRSREEDGGWNEDDGRVIQSLFCPKNVGGGSFILSSL